MTEQQLLQKYGWTLECQSPFEIRHEDGSFASGQAASIVLSHLREEDAMDLSGDPYVEDAFSL
jgi:hypothetical protein